FDRFACGAFFSGASCGRAAARGSISMRGGVSLGLGDSCPQPLEAARARHNSAQRLLMEPKLSRLDNEPEESRLDALLAEARELHRDDRILARVNALD